MPRNVIVAQSGGPSPVINNSLRGVITPAARTRRLRRVYGGCTASRGPERGSARSHRAAAEEIALLATTPAAGASEPAATR